MQNFLKIFGICSLIILFIFLPYFPGVYDHSSVMISVILQISSFISLLYIPIGMIWWLYNKKKHKKNYVFTVIIFIISILVSISAAFTAAGGIGNFRGSLIMSCIIVGVFLYLSFKKFLPWIKLFKKESMRKSIVPYYLIIIPLIVVGVRVLLIDDAESYSMNQAIENSEVMIRDLEQYYAEHEAYPISLQGLWKDYNPGIIGIEAYYYEPNGDAYNLNFEHFSSDLFARKIVMFNQMDEHNFRSHPSFIFSLTSEEHESYRGHFAEVELSYPHWKYYLFD